MSSFENSPKTPNKRFTPLIAGAAATAIVAAGLGTLIGYEAGSHSNELPPVTAKSLEKALNKSHDRVAPMATVEVGYEVPLKEGSGPDGAVAITNPVKLGKDTYGYIDYSNQDHKGPHKVVIHTVKYSGALSPMEEGGHTKAYAHEVMTPLAVVEGEYDSADSTMMYNAFSVVMSDTSGDINDLMNLTPTFDQAMEQRQVVDQLNEFIEERVGNLRYSSK